MNGGRSSRSAARTQAFAFRVDFHQWKTPVRVIRAMTDQKMCSETALRMAENASKAAQFVGKEAQKEMAKPRPKA